VRILEAHFGQTLGAPNNEANTQRVERQKRTPITVIIGNPPYNMDRKSENENHKNRAYDEIDKRIRETQTHLLRDFTRVYHIDLHGNVNRDRTLSGTQHNVFGIQLGVGITIAVCENGQRADDHSLFYHRVPERWTRNRKLASLAECQPELCTAMSQ
jgi:predicted helicase